MTIKKANFVDVMTAYDLFDRRRSSAAQFKDFTIELIIITLVVSSLAAILQHYIFDNNVGSEKKLGIVISALLLTITIIVVLYYKQQFRKLNTDIHVIRTLEIDPTSSSSPSSVPTSSVILNKLWYSLFSTLEVIKNTPDDFRSSIAPSIDNDLCYVNVNGDIDSEYAFDRLSFEPSSDKLIDKTGFNGTFYYSAKKKPEIISLKFSIMFVGYIRDSKLFCDGAFFLRLPKQSKPYAMELTQEFIILVRNSIRIFEETNI